MDNEKKKYVKPVMTIITFEKEDIITTSGFGDDYHGGSGGDLLNPDPDAHFWN